MTLGCEDDSVPRTHGGADVVRLTGFFCDDDLIGHNGSSRRLGSTAAKREHIANDIASQVAF